VDFFSQVLLAAANLI